MRSAALGGEVAGADVFSRTRREQRLEEDHSPEEGRDTIKCLNLEKWIAL